MAKKPRSPGHQARRNDAAKRIKKAYKTSKAQAADYGLTKPKDKIASGKFAADLTKKDIANDRKYDIKNRQNTRKIRTESRAQKKSGKPVELNIKKTIDTARKQMQWDLKKTNKAMGEIVKKTSTPYDRALGKQISKQPSAMETAAKRVKKKTTPAQRAIGKQRVAARRAKLAAKRAADTRTPAQISNDLVKSTARLKNKTARRKLSRNSEGKKNIHKPQKVGKAANTPRVKPPGGGMKGATNLRHLARMTPVGAAVTMGEIAYRLNDTTSKGRSTGGRTGFRTAQQQDRDRAKAKHEPKEN